jgi:hypothetical protein
MDLGFNLPITGADDGGGEAGSSSEGGSDGAGAGDGDNSGEEGAGGDGAAGGGSAGESGGGSAGSGDSFEADLAGKTEAELRTLLVNLRDDRSKKNKQLESMKGTKKELDDAKKKLAAIEREKMNDDQKLAADAKEAAERADESDAKVKKYRIKTAAGSVGVKITDPDFVEYKIDEHLKKNPDATDEDLAKVAADLRKTSPIAFESGNGSQTLDTAGGGAGAAQGRATLQSELDIVNAKLKDRSRLTVAEDQFLVAQQVRLEMAIAGQSGAGT